MNTCITCFSIVFILLLVLPKESQANFNLRDKYHGVNHRNTTNTQLKASQIYSDFEEYDQLDTKFLLNRSHNEVRKRRPKKKRQAYLSKAPQHTRSLHLNHLSGRKNKPKKNQGEGKDVETYETFEEIHEHVNEPDSQEGQNMASERFENQEEKSEAVENIDKKKHDIPVKIKVKHHHHHHHHNHIKEVIKSVPKPYPVEKIVHIPIEKIVEKIVHVPKFVNVTVEKIIHVPVEKIIEKIVRIPKPVHIPKPYLVEKIMEKIIHVPKPYPVLKSVPYPVEIKVPIPVEKKIPVPFTVEVERKVPVYINSHEPYKYEKTYYRNYHEKDMPKFTSETEETPNHQILVSKQTEFPRKLELQAIDEAILRTHTNIDASKTFAPIEQSTAESTFIPLKFLGARPSNTIPLTNDTPLDLNTTLDNKFSEIPYSFPIEFIQIHPMPFQTPLKFDPSIPEPQFKKYK